MTNDLKVIFMDAKEVEGGAEYIAHCPDPEVTIQLSGKFTEELKEFHVEVQHVEWSEGEPENGEEIIARIAEELSRKVSKSLCVMLGEKEPSRGIFIPVTHYKGKVIH